VAGIFFYPPMGFQNIVVWALWSLCLEWIYFPPQHLRHGNLPRATSIGEKKIPFLKYGFDLYRDFAMSYKAMKIAVDYEMKIQEHEGGMS